MLFSIDLKHNNGNLQLATRVIVVAGDEEKELSFDGQDRIEYLAEFGKAIDYVGMATEVKSFVEDCISKAREACAQDGCFYPAAFEFPEIDVAEISGDIKEGFTKEDQGWALQGIPE